MTSDRRAFWLTHLGLPLLLAGLTLLVFETTHWDFTFSELFYDPRRRRFPWRSHQLFEAFGHDFVKWMVVAVGVTTLVLFVSSWWVPRLRPRRRKLGFVFACMALAPLTVGAIKAASKQHCPWDLQQFGGFAPFVDLLDPAIPGLKRGACWPSGHASGGFALYAFYFALRDRRPRPARIVFWSVTAIGLVMGLGRVVQGAHFLSHNLWSGYICWLVCLLLYLLIRPAGSTAKERSPAP